MNRLTHTRPRRMYVTVDMTIQSKFFSVLSS
jgi:hypothetical protein